MRKITLKTIYEWVAGFCRFVFMAVLGFSINFGITKGLHELADWPPEASFAVGLMTVFVFNFFVFRKFVFRATKGDQWQQMLRFFWTSVIFRSGEYLTFLVVHSVMQVDYQLAVISILGSSMLVKFAIYRLIVFRDDQPANLEEATATGDLSIDVAVTAIEAPCVHNPS